MSTIVALAWRALATMRKKVFCSQRSSTRSFLETQEGEPVRRKAATQRVVTLSLLALAGGALGAKNAAADVTLAKEEEGWEIFTNGRVNAFFSYARGDARPQDLYDTSGNLLHAVRGGGMDAQAERVANATGSGYSQGTIEGSR